MSETHNSEAINIWLTDHAPEDAATPFEYEAYELLSFAASLIDYMTGDNIAIHEPSDIVYDRLEATLGLHHRIVDLERTAVLEARDAYVSWERIGEPLDISRQAAQQRFATVGVR